MLISFSNPLSFFRFSFVFTLIQEGGEKEGMTKGKIFWGGGREKKEENKKHPRRPKRGEGEGKEKGIQEVQSTLLLLCMYPYIESEGYLKKRKRKKGEVKGERGILYMFPESKPAGGGVIKTKQKKLNSCAEPRIFPDQKSLTITSPTQPLSLSFPLFYSPFPSHPPIHPQTPLNPKTPPRPS